MIRLIFTCGDINGIGPEICIKTINKIYNPRKRQIFFICPKEVFKNTLKFVSPSFSYHIIDQNSTELLPNKNVIILDLGKYTQKFGKPTRDSGQASLHAIINAVELSKAGIFDAIITAPISKTAFKLGGVPYDGHTELLSELTNCKNYQMMFLSSRMKVSLVTIHIPLKNVPRRVNAKLLHKSIDILLTSLKNDFGIKSPQIAVLGLNPHSGEDGNIGEEEIKIIKPVIEAVKNKNVSGPFVPDAFFGKNLFKKFDAVLGLYHDQVLIPFKMLSFNTGVNFTAGLPIIRTSPDHGTAYDIAGKGVANPSSMIEAVKWAELIFKNRISKK